MKRMTEAKLNSRFKKWMQFRCKESVVIEGKITKGPSLAFSAVQPHQELALRSAAHKCLAVKLADDSVGQKPLDLISVCGVKAYVGVMFYKRGQKEAWLIHIDLWDWLKKKSDRKSVTVSMLEKEGAYKISV